MLVFVDESGDTGLKVTQGSSKYFVISLVVFRDDKKALLCDNEITKLKEGLGKSSSFEFHFQDNSEKIRQAFLETISTHSFIYFSVVIDKNPAKLVGDGFAVKESFYKYACQMVFTNAKPYLDDASVIIDKSGSPTFQKSLKRYLNIKTYDDNKKNIIKKLKQQNSHSNNLLQLADYISGIINRKFQAKKGWDRYYKQIKSKEVSVQKWPK